MDKEQILQKTQQYVREALEGEASGHDWWHIYRVLQLAKHIGEKEGVDMFVVELAALLHDIADYKFHGGDDTAGPRVAGEWLQTLNVDEEVINHVKDIILNMSFKGAKVSSKLTTKEGMIVQDADRLDAIGAMGVARTFAYGGHKGHSMHDPNIKVKIHESFEEYKNHKGTTINHFYEKLLLLKDKMNTETAKQIAEERHKYMEEFLERFYKEWDGKH